MKRFLILFAVMMIALGASAYATEVRTMTMGTNDGIMVDDFNVFRFYGRILNYPNIATAEFDSYVPMEHASTSTYGERDEFYKMGVNWEFNQDNPWVLGTYVSTEPPLYPESFDGGNLVSGWDLDDYFEYYDETNRRLDLLYGRTISNMNFGMHLNYNQSSRKSDIANNDSTRSFQYVELGFGLTEALTGKWDFAVTFGMGSWTDKNAAGDKLTEPDGYYNLKAEGRYFWVQNPKITFVPHAGFMVGKHGVKDYSAGEVLSVTQSETMTAFEAGMGMNYVTGPDLLAVLDFGVKFEGLKFKNDWASADSTDTEDKLSWMTMPYIQLGVEGEVFDWMDIRLGARTYWTLEKYENYYVDKYAENETYLGFGFHFGRLHVDTYADPELFMDGFNFISGANDNHMNLKISALYELF